MSYVKCADFFLAGIIVAWPVMLWSGHLESAIACFILMLFAMLSCAMMVD